MDPVLVGIVGIIVLLVLFFLGVPVAFAMAITGVMGFAYVVGPRAALSLIASDLFDQLGSYPLSVLPMFILMGSMAFVSGIGAKAFEVAAVLFGRKRGGLVVATAWACCIFGAVTGSGAATNMAIGKSAVPEYKKRGYDLSLSLGALACSGTLGFLIPPSIPLAVYGILTEQSIGKLFIAGLIPGLIVTGLLSLTAFLVCKPVWGPEEKAEMGFVEKIKVLTGLSDAVVLFLLVIGGLFAGFFSPTMAGAVGAAGACLIGVLRKELTFEGFKSALKDALGLSCMIFILIIGAMIFGHFITATGLSEKLVQWSSGMKPLSLIIFVCAVYFVLGCFIDITPLLLLLVPQFYPLVTRAGYDPIWFGVVVCILCMIGIVTPPVGTNLFVTKGLVGDEVPMTAIMKGVYVFLLPLIGGLVLVIAFPGLATYLPRFMTY